MGPLLNPVFWRELTDRSRSWKLPLAILTVILVSCCLIFLRWPTDNAIDVVSQSALPVFRPLAFTLALAIMMIVPAFPATSLVTERRRGTLALQLNSPLSPWSIYLSKLSSNVAIACVLVSVSLPAMAAGFAMGGISIVDHVLPLIVVLVSMTVQYSCIGLWVSAKSVSSDAGMRLTYAMVLALAVLSVVPLAFVGNLAGLSSTIAKALTMASPISALQQITSSQAAVAQLGISTGWIEFVVFSCLISLVFAVMTVRLLDPIRLDRARPTGHVVGAGAAKNTWTRRFTYVVDPNKRKSGIPWWVNPIMVKEFRTRKFGRLHWLLRLVALCAVLSLALIVLAATGTVSWGVARIAAPLVFSQLALMLLVGPSLGANLIASEVESGGWQLLQMAPISTTRLMIGKLMSAVWTMLLVLLATIPAYAVLGYVQPAMSGQSQNVIFSLLIAVAMVVSVSACISSLCRTTAVATTTAYGVLLAVFAGTLLIWLGEGKPFSPLLVENALCLNPAAAALSEMGAPGFAKYDLIPNAWWLGGSVSLGCLLVFTLRVWQLSRPD
ncbi:MAG: ABC transporter permease [Planctomycetales bacterium]|nr:ABC transporter permease [Planctomycetales bacterium]